MATRRRRSRFSAPRREHGGSPDATSCGRATRRSGATSAPILYPVVGWTRDSEERVDGVRYPLGLHGFARFQTFAVETSGPDFARLTLSDNSSTRAIYPFAFALAIEYRLSADALAIAIEVANPGERRAPYACGLHPGFRWPLGSAGREGALVQFEKAERPEVPELAPADLSAARHGPSPFAAAICRCPTRCSNATRFASSIVRASRWRLSTPPGRRSRWNMRAFSTRRCGRGPARRSSASSLDRLQRSRRFHRRLVREAQHAGARTGRASPP